MDNLEIIAEYNRVAEKTHNAVYSIWGSGVEYKPATKIEDICFTDYPVKINLSNFECTEEQANTLNELYRQNGWTNETL